MTAAGERNLEPSLNGADQPGAPIIDVVGLNLKDHWQRSGLGRFLCVVNIPHEPPGLALNCQPVFDYNSDHARVLETSARINDDLQQIDPEGDHWRISSHGLTGQEGSAFSIDLDPLNPTCRELANKAVAIATQLDADQPTGIRLNAAV